MASTIHFDQVYKIIESIRSMLRLNYDLDNGYPTNERVFFKLDIAGKRAIRCDYEGEDTVVVITVSWDNNNANLRTLAREAANGLS